MTDPALPMIQWINTAPLADLAVELMAVFDPAISWNVPGVTINSQITDWMFRDYPKQKEPLLGFTHGRPVRAAIAEALQVLEQAGLVRTEAGNQTGTFYIVTRMGVATLANGRPAVRQHIKDRTGL